MPREKKNKEVGKKIFWGLNKTIKFNINIIIRKASLTFIALLPPMRLLVTIGKYLTVCPILKKAIVLVADIEKPFGIKCKYFLIISVLYERSPEFKSGIL